MKINVVAMRGINDDELLDLASLSLEHPWEVRFIELMPVSNQSGWGPDFPDPGDAFLPIPEIKVALAPLGIVPAPDPDGARAGGPAREYRISGRAGQAEGKIGFISPRSEHFCGGCNRLRMTADGSFRPCLLKDEEIPFLAALRSGEPVRPYLEQAIHFKPSGHELAKDRLPSQRTMQQIGG